MSEGCMSVAALVIHVHQNPLNNYFCGCVAHIVVSGPTFTSMLSRTCYQYFDLFLSVFCCWCHKLCLEFISHNHSQILHHKLLTSSWPVRWHKYWSCCFLPIIVFLVMDLFTIVVCNIVFCCARTGSTNMFCNVRQQFSLQRYSLWYGDRLAP